jgi:uncharacterized protein (TIGR02246 family)
MSSPSLALSSAAPVGAADVAAIQSVLDNLTDAWNRHDMDAFVAETAPDVDWINVVGMHWRGRDAVRRAHVALHRGMFAHSRLLPHETCEMRRLAPGVVLVVYSGKIQGVGLTPSGASYPGDGAIMTMVLTRTDDGWRIAHAHNTNMNAMAVAHDPARERG